MRDRHDPTAAASQKLEPLRQDFFRHIFDPQKAETIRAFGHFLFAAALEHVITAARWGVARGAGEERDEETRNRGWLPEAGSAD